MNFTSKLIATFYVGLLFGCAPMSGDPSNLSRAKLLPTPVISNLRGYALPIASTRGQVVLLHFWASWCGQCVAEMPNLNELAAAYQEQGLNVLAVALDDMPASVAGFTSRTHVNSIQIALDFTGELKDALRVTTLPTTFLVDREGYLLKWPDGELGRVGPQDWRNPWLRQTIEAALR